MASDIIKKYEVICPFDNKTDLINVVNLFSDYDQDDFLSKLTQSKKEEIPHEDVYKRNNDDLYIFLFNLWKNNLLDISYDDIKNGDKYDVDFDILPVINYLKRIPDAKSKEEVERFLNPNDDEVKHFINKYGFVSTNSNDWYNINSSGLTLTTEQLNCDGFFTLNIKRYDTPKFCKLFAKMCLEQNIPFSCKYNDGSKINDSFVITYDKKYFKLYLNIIRAIFNEYPNLASRIGKPSYLVGCTNNNLGITVGDFEDYYLKRANHINDCITDMSNSIVANNLKKKINSEIGRVSIINYLSYRIAYIMSDIQCKEAIRNHSYSDYLKFNSNNHKKKLAIAVKKELESRIKNIDHIDEIKINIYDSDITITKSTIDRALREITKTIFNSYPNLYDSLLSYIKISAETFGITSEYCVDITEDKEKETILEKKRA